MRKPFRVIHERLPFTDAAAAQLLMADSLRPPFSKPEKLSAPMQLSLPARQLVTELAFTPAEVNIESGPATSLSL